jgi:ABC-2 type transport system permease protein
MRPASLGWLIAHEFRLSLRDFLAMMTAGKRGREIAVIVVLLAGYALLHLLASVLFHPAMGLDIGRPDGQPIFVTGIILLCFTLMVSQAMESVTRAYYVRSDLDLMLASPIPAEKIFLVRILAVAISTSLVSMLFVSPAINILALREGPHWLAAYPAILALGAIATVAALAVTMLLFRTVGARRTRTIAQIMAAAIGAAFVIGIQLAAIASMNTFSSFALLRSGALEAGAPPADSIFWLPARAAMGVPEALAALVMVAILAMAVAAFAYSRSFGENVLLAAGVSRTMRSPEARRPGPFRAHSIGSALRYKEWKLLARDQWLISQTLMQLLYLVPPAFMLFHGFGSGQDVSAITLPVVVMAAGQLAGGLAWLAVSGEDAPQLVATAPVSRSAVIRAKIGSVLIVIAMLVLPVVAIMAIHDPIVALECMLGVSAAAVSAVAIQLWFRSQARRSDFRRRQTSSKIATITEALSSIMWAAAAGCLAGGAYGLAAGTALAACAVLLAARHFSPPSAREFAF